MRALLIDDYKPFLAALSGFLKRYPNIEIVGQASNGAEGLALAAALEPDVVLVDFSMYGMEGIDVVHVLKAKIHPPRVIMLSFHAEPEYRTKAMQAGADDYVLKSDIFSKLLAVLPRPYAQTDLHQRTPTPAT
jgi:DNA-binding NarL/FixJ family response regulator